MAVFYKIWKKYDEIQLTKNKMNLKNLKMKNQPPSIVICLNIFNSYNYIKTLI